MSTVSVTTSGGVYVPAAPIPRDELEVLATPSGYTVASPADFFSSSPPVTPLGAITNTFTGSLAVPASFFGMDFNNYPGSMLAAGVVPSYDIARVYAGGGAVGSSARVHWAGIEKSAGTYDWTLLDQVIAAHNGAGKKITYVLDVTPTFYSADPTNARGYAPAWGIAGSNAEPSDLAKWDAFCTALATRYAGKITHYEVRNEPNLTSYWTGTQTVLAQMVRRANQAIKAVDSSAKIVSPPITSLYSGGNGVTYFSGMMAASDGAAGTMANWVDVIGCHAYPSSNSTVSALASMASTMRTAMTSAGVSGKPLWNTEFTLLSPAFASVARPDRASAIRQMLTTTAASNSGGFDVSIWYAPDNSTLGWTIDDVSVYEQHRLDMMVGITLVNTIKDGRVAAIVNGKQYLWAQLS